MTCPELIAAMAAQGYWTSPAGKTPQATLHTAVTMLPKLAPSGATIKRARSHPVGDSDLFGLNLDAFHETANDLATCVPVGVIESVAKVPPAFGKRHWYIMRLDRLSQGFPAEGSPGGSSRLDDVQRPPP
jgi:hypothetical protein